MLTVTVATSLQYGNYKQYADRVEKCKVLIRHYLEAFKQTFDFEPNVAIHIRPIKGTTLGRAFQTKPLIEIDPRYKFKDIVETIAHELVHSEQYNQKRLKHLENNRTIWNNQTLNRGTTFKQYWNSPWEVEARKRAAEFLTKHFTHTYLDIE